MSSMEEKEHTFKPFGDGSRISLSWSTFQDLAAASIVLNLLVVCLEVDHPRWPFWNLLDGGFLAVFVMESAIRVRHAGGLKIALASRSWAWFAYDMAVLAVGLLDFVVCCSMGFAAVQSSQVRFITLTRLLRMYRLVRMNRKLSDFVALLGRMSSTFAWILANIVMLCFVLSIALTRIVGPNGLLEASAGSNASEQAQSLFLNIPTSLFTLFQLTTVDNWANIAAPLIKTSVLWRFFFVAFITFVSWTLLSLLTAVASETMLSSTKTKQSEEATLQEARVKGLAGFLCDQFDKADRDDNGTLDKQEFIRLMKQPSMQLEMAEHGLEVRTRDLEHTWNTFDIDESEELSIDELVDGFSFLLEGLSTKHVASVNYILKRFIRKMELTSELASGHLSKLAARQQEVLDMFEEQQEEENEMIDTLFGPKRL